MNELYYEEIHKADRDYPYVQLKNINFSYVAHYHNEIELIYIVSGEAIISINGTDTLLNEKDIFIVMPGEIHSITGTNNVIYIMKFFTDQELMFLKINGHITPDNDYYDIFKSIIHEIAIEDTAKKDGYKYAVNMQSNKLMLEIIRRLKPKKISGAHQKEVVKNIEFLNKVNAYLEKNYKNSINIDQFSSHMGYSKYYFAHMFKDITQQTCIEFITFFRLEKAKISLANGNNVTDTAYECGFNNLRSFNRSFKKYNHISPSDFKKSIR